MGFANIQKEWRIQGAVGGNCIPQTSVAYFRMAPFYVNAHLFGAYRRRNVD